MSSPRKSRRRPHAAAAGRVLASGAGAATFLATISAIALAAPPVNHEQAPGTMRSDDTLTPESAAPSVVLAARERSPTTIVIERVPRTVFVDELGRPLSDAEVAARRAASAPAVVQPPPPASSPSAPAPAPAAPSSVAGAPPASVAPPPAPPLPPATMAIPKCKGSKC